MGKSNYYDKMEWQDSIKVIITQKLHQIRNWEFHNMLYGMSTIEMIENLIIENLTENRVIRRFGWPPTKCVRPQRDSYSTSSAIQCTLWKDISFLTSFEAFNNHSSGYSGHWARVKGHRRRTIDGEMEATCSPRRAFYHQWKGRESRTSEEAGSTRVSLGWEMVGDAGMGDRLRRG